MAPEGAPRGASQGDQQVELARPELEILTPHLSPARRRVEEQLADLDRLQLMADAGLPPAEQGDHVRLHHWVGLGIGKADVGTTGERRHPVGRRRLGDQDQRRPAEPAQRQGEGGRVCRVREHHVHLGGVEARGGPAGGAAHQASVDGEALLETGGARLGDVDQQNRGHE